MGEIRGLRASRVVQNLLDPLDIVERRGDLFIRGWAAHKISVCQADTVFIMGVVLTEQVAGQVHGLFMYKRAVHQVEGLRCDGRFAALCRHGGRVTKVKQLEDFRDLLTHHGKVNATSWPEVWLKGGPDQIDSIDFPVFIDDRRQVGVLIGG